MVLNNQLSFVQRKSAKKMETINTFANWQVAHYSTNLYGLAGTD
jgi:hypothetical protein